MCSEGVCSEGVRCDGVRCDGVCSEGVRCDGVLWLQSDMADPYFAHCKAHSDKDISKRKACSPVSSPTPLHQLLAPPSQRRNYLSALAKQKRFQFTELDDRVRIVHCW